MDKLYWARESKGWKNQATHRKQLMKNTHLENFGNKNHLANTNVFVYEGDNQPEKSRGSTKSLEAPTQPYQTTMDIDISNQQNQLSCGEIL